MSSENLQLVRDAYAAGRLGDWLGMRELTDPDFEWETDARLPNAGVYRGEEDVRRFFEDQAAAFDSVEVELEDAIANADYVVALVRIRRRIRGSTAEIEHFVGHLWTIRDRRLIRGQAFAKREEALAAAGISPEPS